MPLERRASKEGAFGFDHLCDLKVFSLFFWLGRGGPPPNPVLRWTLTGAREYLRAPPSVPAGGLHPQGLARSFGIRMAPGLVP